MDLNRSISMYSLNDLLGTLAYQRGRDWDTDSGYAFVSDLTGISVDRLWELSEETDVCGYEVKGHCGTDSSMHPVGCAESIDCAECEEVENASLDMLGKGLFVEINSRKTGCKVVFNPDEYLPFFNGGFLITAHELG